MTQSEVISAPASSTNKPIKKANNSDRQNSTRSDNPAFTAFEAKCSAIDKRIDAIRAEMVTPLIPKYHILSLLVGRCQKWLLHWNWSKLERKE